MEKENMFGLPKSNTEVFIAPISDDMDNIAIRIAKTLRKRGIPSEKDMMGRKISEQLKYAYKKEIPYVVIVGRKEVESGFVVLRDMRKKKQRKVEISALPTIFESLLN